MNDSDIEGTAVVEPHNEENGRWRPHVGEELNRLLSIEFGERLDERRPVEEVTVKILSECVDPNGPEVRETGLVTGYVQSGKTLSYTSLIAAARDNGYQIIIVIGGRGNNLLEQTGDRLVGDLAISAGPRRPWVHLVNPGRTDLQRFREFLENWQGESPNKKVVLITVLKHANQTTGRLRNVAELLQQIPRHLKGAALIIDDEADQASLNTLVNDGEESANYAALGELRDQLPKHTFLQYTATPQATLFIPLVDHLSPEFCEVLNPGVGYVGGQTFFREDIGQYVRIIPPAETPENYADIGPPSSLEQALKTFFIGVAAAELFYETTGEALGGETYRSMMIHPSRETNYHDQYQNWVSRMRSTWRTILSEQRHPDRASLVEEFKECYEDLQTTVGAALAAFDEILQNLVTENFSCGIKVLNGDEIMKKEEWSDHTAWILIGGEKLDRGFTVKGLTVTYMPRGPGVGNADTIQQRGRFFGYKSRYLAYCRIWLEADTCDRFVENVGHEESMRNFLWRHGVRGALKEPALQRQFQLSPAMQPCRRNILTNPPTHEQLRNGWFFQMYPTDRSDCAQENRQAVENFVRENDIEITRAHDNNWPWLADPSRATNAHIHDIAQVNLSLLYRNLLQKLVMGKSYDTGRWQFSLALIEDYLGRAQEPQNATIAWIRLNETTNRGLNENGRIRAFHSGPAPFDTSQPKVYEGDAMVRMGVATLQIHQLQLHDGPVAGSSGPNWTDVTTIALWVNDRIQSTYIVQR
jgi:hypothetical protein